MEVKSMSQEAFESAVVGMVLGDGCLETRGDRKSARLRVQHCVAQQKYAEYKLGILRCLTHVSLSTVARSNGYTAVQICTRTHPFYWRLRRDLYVGGKTIHPFWLNKLDEHGFAMWFFDDGGSWVDRGEYKTTSRLATVCFSWAENHIIADHFWKRFGIHADVRRAGKGNALIRFPAKSHQRLRDILEPYAEACGMEHKLPDVRPPKGFNLRMENLERPLGNQF